MIADLFWSFATSDLALMILGALLVACLAFGHLPLVRFMPVLGQYALLAQLVAYVALAALCIAIGFRIADERSEMKRLRGELEWRAVQQESAEATAQDAERLQAQAQAEAEEVKGQLDELRDKFSAPPQPVCAFSDVDIQRLRALSAGAAGGLQRASDARLRKSR